MVRRKTIRERDEILFAEIMGRSGCEFFGKNRFSLFRTASVLRTEVVDTESMPFTVGEGVVEDEVFQRDADLSDIMQERGDGQCRFRDALFCQFGSQESADRMRAFKFPFDDLIRADAVIEGFGVEQFEQGKHFPVFRGKSGNDGGQLFLDM